MAAAPGISPPGKSATKRPRCRPSPPFVESCWLTMAPTRAVRWSCLSPRGHAARADAFDDGPEHGVAAHDEPAGFVVVGGCHVRMIHEGRRTQCGTLCCTRRPVGRHLVAIRTAQHRDLLGHPRTTAHLTALFAVARTGGVPVIAAAAVPRV